MFCGTERGSPFLETSPQNTLLAKSTQGVGAAGPTGALGWAYSPPSVDRIWLWAYYSKIPMYLIFYLLKRTIGFGVWG